MPAEFDHGIPVQAVIDLMAVPAVHDPHKSLGAVCVTAELSCDRDRGTDPHVHDNETCTLVRVPKPSVAPAASIIAELASVCAHDLTKLVRHGDKRSKDTFLRLRNGTTRGNQATLRIHDIKLTIEIDIGAWRDVFVATIWLT